MRLKIYWLHMQETHELLYINIVKNAYTKESSKDYALLQMTAYQRHTIYITVLVIMLENMALKSEAMYRNR